MKRLIEKFVSSDSVDLKHTRTHSDYSETIIAAVRESGSRPETSIRHHVQELGILQLPVIIISLDLQPHKLNKLVIVYIKKFTVFPQ